MRSVVERLLITSQYPVVPTSMGADRIRSELPYSPGHKQHQLYKVRRFFYLSIRHGGWLVKYAARPPPSSIASAVLSFMNRPKDVNNAKFCAESNGCVGGFWKQLHGVAI